MIYVHNANHIEKTIYFILEKNTELIVKKNFYYNCCFFKFIYKRNLEKEKRRVQEFSKKEEAIKFFLEIQKCLFDKIYFEDINDT